jgi:pimeloyl-ACP methyl ester carboxylesterase
VRRWTRIALTVLGVLLLVVAGALVYSWAMPDFTPASHPNPVKSYDEAVARIQAQRAADPAAVAYHEIFVGQGSKTTTAVVLFHGFTNNPRQMQLLVDAYAAQGYNVYVPRIPHHGMSDRMSGDLANATRRELIAWTDDAIDIGAGLGDHVVVSGLSAGATLSAWAAKNRSEVSEAVLVAPLIQPTPVPGWLTKPIYQLTPALPPIWMWWNPAKKEAQQAPETAYPRYTIRSLGDYMAIAASLTNGKPKRTGKLARVVIITNDADIAVRNDIALATLRLRLKPLTAEWQEFAIPKGLGWKHDIIDPLGENVGKSVEIYRRILPMFRLPRQRSTDSSATVTLAAP